MFWFQVCSLQENGNLNPQVTGETNDKRKKKNYYGTAVGRNKITLRLSTINVDVRDTFFFFKHSTEDSQQQGFMP
jgi:hypothetical protein